MTPEKQLRQDLEEALEPTPTREWERHEIEAFHDYLSALDAAGRFTLVARYVKDRADGEDPDHLLNKMAGRVAKFYAANTAGGPTC